METNSRPEATASPVKQGQYSPRKRKDTTPKVNPQLAVELVYQELKRVEAYTKRIENAMEKGSQLEMSIEPDISILSEMLKRDRETEIFIRGLNECHTLNVGSEFTGIKNELTTYLGRLYTKEFFYLFTEGKYSPNTSQFILLHYFDNVIWQVEQLQKNGFLFLESNIKKENDEESLYDSYDDGIPIKFLINKGRLDFSKIMYESTEKNETNNIK